MPDKLPFEDLPTGQEFGQRVSRSGNDQEEDWWITPVCIALTVGIGFLLALIGKACGW